MSSCPASSPASATATACTAPTNRRRASLQPEQAAAGPYAKAIDGTFHWDQSLFSYNFGDPDSRNDEDSAASMPRSVVINPFFDWGVDRPPKREYADSVIYEAHVKGLTQTHPDIPEAIRGTYSAIAHPVIIDHLKTLGVTAIELMPVHHFANDSTLIDKGLSNYWGYNTIGFFAPDPKYTSSRTPGGQVQEFKAMVRALHEADIEVILDVVYNHTAEGNHMARRCPCAASTTPPTTARSTTTSGTTWTTPVPGTRSTSGTRTRCS